LASGDDYQTIWLPNTVMRERAEVPAVRELPDRLEFIVPEYVDYLETGEPHYAITSRRDFDRVKDGYACPRCLLKFNTHRTSCPLCPWERDLSRDISDQVYDYWKPGPSRTSAEILGAA